MLDELELPYDETGYRPRSHRRRKRSGGAARTLITLFLVLGLLGGLAAGGVWAWGKIQDKLQAADYSGAGKEPVDVVIQPRDTATQIANTLYKADVVKSARAFVDEARTNAESQNIQPGHYGLKKQMSAKAALAALLDLKNRKSTKVTIKEGLSNIQTFKELEKATKIPYAEFVQAAQNPDLLAQISDPWFVVSPDNERQPKAKSIEGFLYPETYDFDPGVTAPQILRTMVQQFVDVVTELQFDAKAQGALKITPYEALITASLIVDEGIEKDFAKIARVVYNRLFVANGGDGMPLQFDSCTNYWFERNGQPRKDRISEEENKDPNNPYNTYTVRGLPPGPIANPGKAALQAAVNPEKGPWLYFVKAEPDGSSHFSATYEEHQEWVARCAQRGLGC